MKAVWLDDAVQGFPTIVTSIFFLGGVQLLTLGLVGEYMGRMYDETKQRPLYICKQKPKLENLGN